MILSVSMRFYAFYWFLGRSAAQAAWRGCRFAAAGCCLRAIRGLTAREIADRLYISPKAADHHIQHVYTKIGVSTRAAAALWAMQNAVVG